VSWIRFEWDEAKNLSNQRKHGISFEDASEAFRDPCFVTLKDRIENGDERWQTFGKVVQRLLVMVAHSVREEDADGSTIEVIRIISARFATPREIRIYEAENG
jgi:uncharacterized DUF497 family protein